MSKEPIKADSIPEVNARAKAMARESRFNFRNLAEHQLRRELKEDAIEKCDPQIKDFAQCAMDTGLMVVWSCRNVFSKVNECMEIHNGDDAWQAYRKKHEAEIVKKAKFGLT